MTQMIYCQRLKREAERLSKAPFPGVNGLRVFAEISQAGWGEWLAHQTMLINENRLSPLDPKAKKYLTEQMALFLFGTGADAVAGFVAPNTKSRESDTADMSRESDTADMSRESDTPDN
jgi:Fe-S cluster biosynthesis and repair protein YggX